MRFVQLLGYMCSRLQMVPQYDIRKHRDDRGVFLLLRQLLGIADIWIVVRLQRSKRQRAFFRKVNVVPRRYETKQVMGTALAGEAAQFHEHAKDAHPSALSQTSPAA